MAAEVDSAGAQGSEARHRRGAGFWLVVCARTSKRLQRSEGLGRSQSAVKSVSINVTEGLLSTDESGGELRNCPHLVNGAYIWTLMIVPGGW